MKKITFISAKFILATVAISLLFQTACRKNLLDQDPTTELPAWVAVDFELIEEYFCPPIPQRIGWSTISLQKKSVKKEVKNTSKLLKKTDLGGRFGHTMCALSAEMMPKINSMSSSTSSNSGYNPNPRDSLLGLLVFGGVNEEKDFNDVWLIEKI